MEKPSCYAECAGQRWLYDSHEKLEEAIRQRLLSAEPHVKLTAEDAAQLRAEQEYFRETSAIAAGTCRGLLAKYILYRTSHGGTEAVPAGRYCEATMPANLQACFGRAQPELPDNR